MRGMESARQFLLLLHTKSTARLAGYGRRRCGREKGPSSDDPNHA